MIDEREVPCPYCGETLALAVDLSAGSTTYVEDCHVCCQPILVRLRVAEDGTYTLDLEQENG